MFLQLWLVCLCVLWVCMLVHTCVNKITRLGCRFAFLENVLHHACWRPHPLSSGVSLFSIFPSFSFLAELSNLWAVALRYLQQALTFGRGEQLWSWIWPDYGSWTMQKSGSPRQFQTDAPKHPSGWASPDPTIFIGQWFPDRAVKWEHLISDNRLVKNKETK